jgi:hypothetical protein
MSHAIRRLPLMLGAIAIVLGASAGVLAQGTAPARETPRPQDIDPGVNTSSPAQAPARETPRPQDIDPAVNTSAAAPANEAGNASSPTTGNAAKNTPPARGTTPGAATPSTSSAPNASGSASGKPTAGTRPAAGPDGKPRGKGQDRLELDTTQITGNRELPKVLYIVPWKRADLGDLVGKPVNSLLDEVLAPVDRDVFKRENRYYRALTPVQPAAGNTVPSSAPASGATPAATSSGSAAPASRDER